MRVKYWGEVMNFGQAVLSVLGNYATFVGRACRSEYWYWTLFAMVVVVCLSILDTAVFSQILWKPLSTIFGLAILLPAIAVTARRLHDINKSGWWMLVVLIPVVGWIILLVWEIRKGDGGDNRFGHDPLAGGSAETTQS
jgi:uncharacterized membrane protein YhaH (DUF805 family)